LSVSVLSNVKGMGASGSKGASGKAGSGAASIESRQIARKANKEDLFTVATYHILAGKL
jgi:hypothetical protein